MARGLMQSGWKVDKSNSHKLNLPAVGRWLRVISHFIANTTSPLILVVTDLLGRGTEGNKICVMSKWGGLESRH